MTIDKKVVEQRNHAEKTVYKDRLGSGQRPIPGGILVGAILFILGMVSGYLLRGAISGSQNKSVYAIPDAETTLQVELPENYTLPVYYGDIGPKLLASGAIDYERFSQVYEKAGQPLSEIQKAILKGNWDGPIVVNQENSYFLLNFFWAFGLTNQNPILTEGPMMQDGGENVGRFASTGGWTIGAKQPTELFASETIISLTLQQQERLERVAQNVYRPCCDNPTHFPDCNHGMAMLGVLELLASQDVSEETMFETAKQLNAFWFPQQTYELATYMKMTQDLDFVDIDAKLAVGNKFFSGSGFQNLHRWLSANNGLEQIPNRGNSCGV